MMTAPDKELLFENSERMARGEKSNQEEYKDVEEETKNHQSNDLIETSDRRLALEV